MTCDDFCLTDFDARFDGSTDDTKAWIGALAEIRSRRGGRLLLPRGTSITSQPIQVPANTTIEGQGRDVTRIQNSHSDVFRLTNRGPLPPEGAVPAVENTCFRDLSVVSYPSAGHIFVLQGRAEQCSWRDVSLEQGSPGKQIFRRVTNSQSGGFFDCLWEHVQMKHAPNATVSAFEVWAPSQQFNSNTLRNVQCENSWDAPFFKFTCNAMQRNNNCVMSEIEFRACYGGMVHWYTAGNWTCEGLVQYEVTRFPIRGDGLYLGRAPGRSASRHMTFIGCDRRSGLLGNVPMQAVDLRLAAAEHTVVINCGENPPARYTVDAHNLSLTWIGLDDPVDFRLGPRLLNRKHAVRIGEGAVRARIIEQDPEAT